MRAISFWPVCQSRTEIFSLGRYASNIRHAESRPAIREAALRYFYASSAQLLQATACDRLRTLERRCCRALLLMPDSTLMQDSTGEDELALTQESLAALLGGGRPRINFGTLERKGLLCRRRGRIRLLRRAGLEERSCDCYRIVRRICDPPGLPTNPLRSVA
jgi:hypothetical protein